MKKSRMIMSLCAAAFLGLLAAGCHSEPVDLGPVPPPKGGEPLAGIHGSGGIGYDEFGNPIKGGGAPGKWSEGAGNLPPRGSGDFEPVSGISFEPVYFEYDRSDLKPSEMDKLRKVAEFLNSRRELGLIIEGHCDDRGSEEYNRALGERRANAIRSYLAGVGLDDGRMKTISYGEDRPAVTGSNEAAWSKNRRGVLVPAKKN